MEEDEPNLYLQILIVCEEHGVVTDHTRELIERVVESLAPYEKED
jgi:hypothetical protein